MTSKEPMTLVWARLVVPYMGGGGHDSKRNVENNSEIQATACMQALSFSGTGKRRCVGIV